MSKYNDYLDKLTKIYRRELTTQEKRAFIFAVEGSTNPERVLYQFINDKILSQTSVERANTALQKRRAAEKIQRRENKRLREEAHQDSQKQADEEAIRNFDKLFNDLLDGKAPADAIQRLAYHRINIGLPPNSRLSIRTQRIHDEVKKEMRNIQKQIKEYQRHSDLV